MSDDERERERHCIGEHDLSLTDPSHHKNNSAFNAKKKKKTEKREKRRERSRRGKKERKIERREEKREERERNIGNNIHTYLLLLPTPYRGSMPNLIPHSRSSRARVNSTWQ
jgi:hypothetical protein